MPPHSRTVRGTLSNPKTKEAMKNPSPNRTQLGDPGSLKVEHKPSDPVPGRTNQDGASTSSSQAPPSSEGQGGSNQSHSAHVRGTISHPFTQDKVYMDSAGEARGKVGEGGKEGGLPGSLLEDPESLKAEKSSEGGDKEGGDKEEVARRRKNGEVRGGSKL